MVRLIDDPLMGQFHIPGNPLRMSAQPDELDLVAPLLGEHNAAVLGELGYTDTQIADLEAAGVVRSAPT
jgi:crotonobetainyl-CoA:carnitine CoA-transferase CaiB-like acyl-CoA transferase